METDTASRFLWHDLDSPDPSRALGFYGDVLGWSPQPFEGSPMRYWLWMRDGAPIGGIGELTDESRDHGARAGWNGYVESRDVDVDVERVVSLGGRVRVPAVTLETVGRMAVVDDPQGASFTLFTPDPMMDDAPPASTSPIGKFAWHDLATSDSDAAFAFYSAMFGWQESRRIPMGPMGAYRIFAVDGVEAGGMMTTPAGQSGSPGWLYYIRVDDIDGAVGRVLAGDGTVLGIDDVPGGRTARCLDPEGAAFGLYEQTDEPSRSGS